MSEDDPLSSEHVGRGRALFTDLAPRAVIGVDFGTTHSGFACACVADPARVVIHLPVGATKATKVTTTNNSSSSSTMGGDTPRRKKSLPSRALDALLSLAGPSSSNNNNSSSHVHAHGGGHSGSVSSASTAASGSGKFAGAFASEEQDVRWKEPSCALFKKDSMTLVEYGFAAQQQFLELKISEKVVNAFTHMDGSSPLHAAATAATIMSELPMHRLASSLNSINRSSLARVTDSYYYFENVKLRLFISIASSNKAEQQSARAITVGGNASVPLGIVVSKILEYLKNKAIAHLMASCSTQDLGADFDPAKHIQWVFTVPAISGEEEKHFMRQCCFDAGIIDNIHSQRLVLALEPECCAIAAHSHEVCFDKVGEKILCVDAGGGTVDTCCLEVDQGSTPSNLKLKQVLASSGGPWGSRVIDLNFRNWFEQFVGAELLNDTFKRDPSIEISVMKQWEELKVSLHASDLLETSTHKSKTLDLGDLAVELPVTLRHLCDAWNTGKAYKEYAKLRGFPQDTKCFLVTTKHSEGLLHISEPTRVQLSPFLLLSFFEPVLTQIVDHVNSIVQDKQLSDLKHILLVGGLGTCPLLQQMLRDKFSGKIDLITSKRSSALTVIGAVTYGLQPEIISSRISKYNIGIKASVKYDASKHFGHTWEKHKFYDRMTRLLYVRNVFIPYVIKNESVEVSHQILHTFRSRNQALDEAKFELYYTDSDTIPEVVEGCRKLCTILVKIRPRAETVSGREEEGENMETTSLQCAMMFGASEFTVTVKNLLDGSEEHVKIRYDDV